MKNYGEEAHVNREEWKGESGWAIYEPSREDIFRFLLLSEFVVKVHAVSMLRGHLWFHLTVQGNLVVLLILEEMMIMHSKYEFPR